MSIIVPLPVYIVVPLFTAFIMPIFGKKGKAAATTLANIATISLLALAVLSIGQSRTYEMGEWSIPLGINLVLDGLSSLVLLAISIVSAAAAWYPVISQSICRSRAIYCETAMDRQPNMAASRAAATVPELYTSEPRLAPGLIPDISQRASGAICFNAIREQSAGLPSTQKRLGPV